MRGRRGVGTWGAVALAALYGCGDPSPCDDLAIPDDCAVDTDGQPVEDVCRVEGDPAFEEATFTCGRANGKYLASLCVADRDAVTVAVAAAIVCDRQP